VASGPQVVVMVEQMVSPRAFVVEQPAVGGLKPCGPLTAPADAVRSELAEGSGQPPQRRGPTLDR
jgi:hypothetical protein